MERGQGGSVGESAAEVADLGVRLKAFGLEAFEVFRDAKPIVGHRHLAWGELSQAEQGIYADDLMESVMRMEDVMPRVSDLAILTPQAARRLDRAINDYHDALPFTPAERRWFYAQFCSDDEALQSADPLDHAGIVNRIAKTDGRIITIGKREHVRGAELVRRWWAWRRGAGEYEGDSTVDVAHDALRRIAFLVLRNGTLDLSKH
jgi:hypothetical protein